MKKRNIILAIVGLIVVIFIVIIFTGGKDDSVITIASEGSFTQEQCESRGLSDKLIMLESKYCHACESTKPIFLEVCESEGITPLILDISETEDFAQMESFWINVQYTPTFVFGCDYYVGEKSKSDYENYLDKFMVKQ